MLYNKSTTKGKKRRNKMDKKQTSMLMTKINNLVNALEDIGIKCSINTYTHYENKRKCISVDTDYSIYGEEVSFCWYLDTGNLI